MAEQDKSIKKGWLTKQGGQGLLTSNWRKRYFVLGADEFLYYYKNAGDASPSGVIYIPDFTECSAVSDSKRKFVFTLSAKVTPSLISQPIANTEASSFVGADDLGESPAETPVDSPEGSPEFENVDLKGSRPRPSRVYKIQAGSEEEMQEWIAAIQPLLNGRNGPISYADDAEVTGLLAEVSVQAIKTDCIIMEPVAESAHAVGEGVKLSTLDRKFDELSCMMSNLESLSKEELKVLYDTFRMCHKLIQKEKLSVKIPDSPVNESVEESEPVGN